MPAPTASLVFGEVPAEGRRAASWEEFCQHAESAPSGVAVVEARASGADGDLCAWMRQTAGRPEIVAVAPRQRQRDLLEAGAAEVVAPEADPPTVAAAIERAEARAVAGAEGRRFRRIIEHTHDIVTVLDSFGRFTYVSPSVEDILGFTPEALIGTNAFETLVEDDVASVMEVFLAAIGTPGMARRLSYRSRTASGEVRHLEGVGRALLGSDGVPYAVINARDVTRRAETEDALRASEARFRSLLAALPDVISRLRRDGTVVDFHVPPAFATEFPPEAMLGKRLNDEIPAPLAAMFDDAVAKVDTADGPVTYRYEVAVAGDPHYREVRLVPLGDEEVISILRDVTPEVLAEQGLRESKASLERSQAELRALAAHLQDVREEERAHLSREVHDTLGQQLTAIRYAVGWFGRQLEGDEEADRRLSDARALIDETIQNVRQIAADLRPGVLDDFGIATALEWVAERTTDRTGLDVRVEAHGDASGVPDDIATAAFRIVQEALTNVARHADASSVRILVDARPDGLRVTVRDDGVGLDADALAARRSLGVLGMRERARAHGGVLHLTGAPGEGATVSVFFSLPDPA